MANQGMTRHGLVGSAVAVLAGAPLRQVAKAERQGPVLGPTNPFFRRRLTMCLEARTISGPVT